MKQDFSLTCKRTAYNDPLALLAEKIGWKVAQAIGEGNSDVRVRIIDRRGNDKGLTLTCVLETGEDAHDISK